MFVRTAEPSDLPRLRFLLASAVELDFDPSPVVEEKVFGPGFGGPARCRVVLDEDAIRGFAVTSGSSIRLIAVEPGYRGRGLGAALLEDAVDTIRLSFNRVVVGAAAGNYLVPGIPVTDRKTIEFFMTRGFEETGRTTDMIVALGGLTRPEVSRMTVDRVSEYDERLREFLSTSFGPAIAWEIGHGLLSDGPVIRIAKSGDEIVGFTACEVNNRGLGTFGPQGVSEAMRERGIGRHLLMHSLADLRKLGYSKARIPWVSSTGYYERACGAVIAGEYVVMRRRL